jgi:hypothetical protein
VNLQNTLSIVVKKKVLFTVKILTNNSVLWDITPSRPWKVNRHFGGTCRLHLQGRSIRQVRNQLESRWQSGLDHWHILCSRLAGPHSRKETSGIERSHLFLTGIESRPSNPQSVKTRTVKYIQESERKK